MPRVRRRARLRLPQINSMRVRSQLCCGQVWPFLDHHAPELLEDELCEAWDMLRDELMEAWMAFGPIPNTWQDHGEPGTRPWAWWAYDSPEPRRSVRGDGTTTQQAPYGDPWRCADGFEPSFTYLHRCGLLQAGELEAIRRNWPQETVREYLLGRSRILPEHRDDPSYWLAEDRASDLIYGASE